jgi:DNA-binding beta-propeller fold protein YncE
MALQALGFIQLPPHVGDGGFDHAAVHEPTGHVYVAHTANDALDVLDVEKQRYVGSIGGLTAVAGALVVEPDSVFTCNRGENTIGIMRVGHGGPVEKVAVGLRPNGLAHDGGRNRLLAAHVCDPGVAGSRTVSVVDVRTRDPRG